MAYYGCNLQITDPALTTNEVIEEVGDGETPDLPHDAISDGAARAIAGWWASPRLLGYEMGLLAQGRIVSSHALRADVQAQIDDDSIDPSDLPDLRALLHWIDAKEWADQRCDWSGAVGFGCQEERENDLPFCPSHMRGLTREDLEA